MKLIPYPVSTHCLESYFIKITSRSKIIYWIIIAIIVTGIAVLPLIYVDVSVQARGYFQSEIEKQLVHTPFHGRVVFASFHNGDKVTKGDTLLIIESETIRAQQNALKKRIDENDASINDLEILTGIDSSILHSEEVILITKRYQAEFENVVNQHGMQNQKYQKRKAEHERNELLFEQKIIPETDHENSLYALKSEKDNLNQILIYQRSVWQNDLTSRKNEAVRLQAEYKHCIEELNNRIVLAPTSGEVIQSSDIQTGSVVSQGQLIAELSPQGELIATCFARPADIGLIRENQKVKIQVDAFNYNEWGMLTGSIIDISDDMIVENGATAYFRIRCKPDQTYLSLKNGHKAFIKKGMSINTRIFVIRRSLYNLLFDKADKWFNPYTYKPE
jgi:HlyD family secretion protein